MEEIQRELSDLLRSLRILPACFRNDRTQNMV
jgi:hypothetical protein